MSEQDCKECQVAAVALKGVSLLGVVLFITIPTTFMMLQNHTLSTFEKGFFMFFLLTGLLFGFRSWHLYFDSRLLKSLGNKKLSLSDVDQIVIRLFRKNIQGKTIQVRIKSCYKLVKGFLVLLVLHLLCYSGVIVLFLF
ncbi:hypothetical protein FNW52_03770 [Flavobacterium sp. ZT3R18]|uniref:hypothetical protein n=1 Tax=Flavobacterium sp. ZT3R18 TaxID=2594429 RepID=UPI00117B7E52|nr:hypothetical protein [Flavobacterium sp. ZT3R18]TRX38030.1 hypothetical protein FNW52_03770 [Flavobacterium sp. ZT3R18]